MSSRSQPLSALPRCSASSPDRRSAAAHVRSARRRRSEAVTPNVIKHHPFGPARSAPRSRRHPGVAPKAHRRPSRTTPRRKAPVDSADSAAAIGRTRRRPSRRRSHRHSARTGRRRLSLRPVVAGRRIAFAEARAGAQLARRRLRPPQRPQPARRSASSRNSSGCCPTRACSSTSGRDARRQDQRLRGQGDRRAGRPQRRARHR